MSKILPRYPIYVPSKGRADKCLTANFLAADGVPFRLVVEPPDRDAYAARYGIDRVLVLPFQDLGLGAVPARNWIKQHSIAEGHARHWQLDDNMWRMRRFWKSKRIPCPSGPAFAAIEDFADRYENVALAGPSYTMFAMPASIQKPFYLNVHVYSCTLVLNSIPNGWRYRYNDDTDLCLQVLSEGWCTVLVNVFMVDKVQTMKLGGGMTSMYVNDGRLKMARALERQWPGVVRTKRRFRRPQHRIRGNWQKFDTPLKLRPGVDRTALAGSSNEYGMALMRLDGRG
jgi:hypothetical protein